MIEERPRYLSIKLLILEKEQTYDSESKHQMPLALDLLQTLAIM